MDKKLFFNRKHSRINDDRSKNIVFAIYFVLFIIAAFICLYPLYWTFINSLKTQSEFYDNPHGLPKIWHFELYKDVFNTLSFRGTNFWGLVFNSIWLTFGGQLFNLIASLCVAYPLARYKFPGKKFFYGIIIFRITIPIIGAGSAAYKLFRTLGMVNNPLLFLTTFFTGFDMQALIMYGYFKGISREYSDAACIDGASVFKSFVCVILPQALPCAMALYINAVMGRWNDYITPLIYLPKYPNLAYAIYEIKGAASYLGKNSKALYFGSILLSAIVPVVLFSVSQKLMINNMSVGGLKG